MERSSRAREIPRERIDPAAARRRQREGMGKGTAFFSKTAWLDPTFGWLLRFRSLIAIICCFCLLFSLKCTVRSDKVETHVCAQNQNGADCNLFLRRKAQILRVFVKISEFGEKKVDKNVFFRVWAALFFSKMTLFFRKTPSGAKWREMAKIYLPYIAHLCFCPRRRNVPLFKLFLGADRWVVVCFL